MTEQPYPDHWEADVVLSDGAPAHVRPILPTDAQLLVEFYARVSPESKYLRFFAPYPELTPRDVERFTSVDHNRRVALIVVAGGQMIAVGRYDWVGESTAEVAFLVEDAHQGRGLGSVLLEHLAAAARERGISRFEAEVLPANRKMIQVFRDAGYSVSHGYEDGVVHLRFDIEPTEASREVMASREHRAEARSIARLLHPTSVVVVGASRTYRSVGQTVLRTILDAGFTGDVAVVNPGADEIAGVRSYASLRDVPGHVDLAVVAVPADQVELVVADAAAKQVHGIVVVSAGFAETGSEGRERQRRLVRLAHASGMRVVGPNSFGLINTDPEVRLDASLYPRLPVPGRIGFFSQSGALGMAILEALTQRGLGLSTFVNAGNRADVSGNDLLQYWQDDAATDVVMLYLESVGNPRKFARLARRLARSKPVVVVKSGNAGQGVPLGHAVRTSQAPPAVLDALFRQSGVIRVENLSQMFDAAAVLASQPLPQGDRVAIVSNSDALAVLAADACESWRLPVAVALPLGAEATGEDFDRALTRVFDDPDVDAVVAVFVPPLLTPDEDVVEALARCAEAGTKPVVSTFLGMRALVTSQSAAQAVPSYPTPEDAVRALAAQVRYAEWRRRPVGEVPSRPDPDIASVRHDVDSVLRRLPDGGELSQEETRELLAHCGIQLWEALPVTTADEAVAAGHRLGLPVVLKATASPLRHRSDSVAVRLDLATDAEVLHAWHSLVEQVGHAGVPAEHAGFVVQRMAAPGTALRLTSEEDPLLGPYVSVGLAGVASDLLGDVAYRVPPLTDLEAAAMVRSLRAAPLLLGYRGAEPLDVAAAEDLLLTLAALADEVPQLRRLELNPVVVSAQGLAVLGSAVTVAPALARHSELRRMLPA
ncbi:MAG: bifunctional acetate--CoA ligase family protein/GNAT family N-acetyltransferase [Actinomycetes bacterium]